MKKSMQNTIFFLLPPPIERREVVLSFIFTKGKSRNGYGVKANQGSYHGVICHQGSVRPPENSTKDARNYTNRMRSFPVDTGP